MWDSLPIANVLLIAYCPRKYAISNSVYIMIQLSAPLPVYLPTCLQYLL